jgi:Flp pilus assembly protein TadB
MTIVVAFLAAAAVGGLYLLVTGVAGGQRPPRVVRTLGPAVRGRAMAAGGAAAAGGLLTRWPLAAIACGALAWFAPDLFGSHAARGRETRRTEAIATWTEMLRDTIAGAHGLEEAITSTAAVAPVPIRGEVVALAARLERQPLVDALAAFADDLDHPIGDLVVASLGLSARGAVGDLVDLLGTLAVAARDEAVMRLRVEAARARLRTAVRVISGCTLLMALGLVVLNPGYLEVYDSFVGQLVLGTVFALWGVGLWWLTQMGRFIAPERFLAVGAEGRT